MIFKFKENLVSQLRVKKKTKKKTATEDGLPPGAGKAQLTSWARVPRLSSNIFVPSASSWLRKGDIESSPDWNEKKKKILGF